MAMRPKKWGIFVAFDTATCNTAITVFNVSPLTPSFTCTFMPPLSIATKYSVFLIVVL